MPNPPSANQLLIIGVGAIIFLLATTLFAYLGTSIAGSLFLGLIFGSATAALANVGLKNLQQYKKERKMDLD